MLRHRPHPTWACHGGTWSGERERAAGQSSPAPATMAAGRSSLARTGGRAKLAFACTCGGRGAAALKVHPWRLGRSSPGARSRRQGGLRAELACAHGGRGGAPRHTRSWLPGRARLRPSPRRPAGAPPRAGIIQPLRSPSIQIGCVNVFALSLCTSCIAQLRPSTGAAHPPCSSSRPAHRCGTPCRGQLSPAAFSSSLILSHARLDAVVLSSLTVGRFVQQVGRNMKLIDVQLSAAISVVVDCAPVGLGPCCRAVLLWG